MNLGKICHHSNDQNSCSVGGGYHSTTIDNMIITSIAGITLTTGNTNFTSTTDNTRVTSSTCSEGALSTTSNTNITLMPDVNTVGHMNVASTMNSYSSSLSNLVSTINRLIPTESSGSYTPVLGSSFFISRCDVNGSDEMTLWLELIRNITSCSNGFKYCPLNLNCIPDDSPCTVNLANDVMRNSSRTPWGTNCTSTDHYFCLLFMKCIHVSEVCSYHALYHWYLTGNTTHSPFGQVCDHGERFCFLNMSCIPENRTCEVPALPPYKSLLKRTKYDCVQGNYFCPHLFHCISETDPCNRFEEYTHVPENEDNDPSGKTLSNVCTLIVNLCGS